MIDLYYWPTPNGHKVTMLLEEAGVDCRISPLDISAGDRFKLDFLASSPKNRMPAIINHAPADGGNPVPVFESGAILVYLAEKIERFLPSEMRRCKTVLEWVYWQMGGLGPMLQTISGTDPAHPPAPARPPSRRSRLTGNHVQDQMETVLTIQRIQRSR